MNYTVQIKQLNNIKLQNIENEVNNALKEIMSIPDSDIIIHNIDIKYINDVSIFAEVMIVYTIEPLYKEKQVLYS